MGKKGGKGKKGQKGQKGQKATSANAVAIETPADVCAKASGRQVIRAFARLGPISGAQCSLYQQTNDPAAQLAAEQIVHLLDGWKYACAAFTSFLLNSRANAVHFAYYAELRAALSLYAGSGINVNQASSFYVDESGDATKIRGNTRTHTIAWELWKSWIKRQDASNLLTKRIRLMTGLALEDFSSVPNISASALQSWGYDLFTPIGDHLARNTASYTPGISEPLYSMTPADAQLIKRIWSLLLPTQHGVGFDTALINYLVISTVRERANEDSSRSFDEHLRDTLEQVSSRTGIDAVLISRLLLESKPDTELFQKAAAPTSEPDNVICRAVFLLRMATLSLETALAAAGSSDAGEWVRIWLRGAGLYPDTSVSAFDLNEDYLLASEAFGAQGADLPRDLWDPSGPNLGATSRLVRPEAFVAWAVPL